MQIDFELNDEHKMILKSAGVVDSEVLKTITGKIKATFGRDQISIKNYDKLAHDIIFDGVVMPIVRKGKKDE